MLFHRKVKVLPHERVLVFREGALDAILKPGVHKVFDPLRKLTLEKVNLREVYFKHDDLDTLSVELAKYPNLVRVLELADHERAFVFVDGKFERVLKTGLHVLWTGLRKLRVDVVDMHQPVYANVDLPRIVRGATLEEDASVLDLKDGERALVWVDGRFRMALKPGLYLVWKGLEDVRVEVLDATGARLEHESVSEIANSNLAHGTVTVHTVDAGQVGLWFQDGKFVELLKPGTHAFWTGVGRTQVFLVPLRERTLDIGGQEIMTSDKVTLRLNALITFRVTDALKYVQETEDAEQALYRDAQLTLRAVVGAYELDKLLTEKDAVARELEEQVKALAPVYGLEVRTLGIRDVILPGEMKELMNKVTEAKKAAEAGLITRREETAAARMQANTAKVLDNSRQRSALPSEHRGRDPDAHEAARAGGAGEDRGQGQPHGTARRGRRSQGPRHEAAVGDCPGFSGLSPSSGLQERSTTGTAKLKPRVQTRDFGPSMRNACEYSISRGRRCIATARSMLTD